MTENASITEELEYLLDQFELLNFKNEQVTYKFSQTENGIQKEIELINITGDVDDGVCYLCDEQLSILSGKFMNCFAIDDISVIEYNPKRFVIMIKFKDENSIIIEEI